MADFLCMICASNTNPSPKRDICTACYMNLNKKCSECKTVKKYGAFHANRGICKPCFSAYMIKKKKQAAANKT